MTNRAKDAKRWPVRLEMGGARAPVPFFPEKQSATFSEEVPAASREGAKSQAGYTVSSAGTA